MIKRNPYILDRNAFGTGNNYPIEFRAASVVHGGSTYPVDCRFIWGLNLNNSMESFDFTDRYFTPLESKHPQQTGPCSDVALDHNFEVLAERIKLSQAAKIFKVLEDKCIKEFDIIRSETSHVKANRSYRLERNGSGTSIFIVPVNEMFDLSVHHYNGSQPTSVQIGAHFGYKTSVGCRGDQQISYYNQIGEFICRELNADFKKFKVPSKPQQNAIS
jgi:hypothetical protein